MNIIGYQNKVILKTFRSSPRPNAAAAQAAGPPPEAPAIDAVPSGGAPVGP